MISKVTEIAHLQCFKSHLSTGMNAVKQTGKKLNISLKGHHGLVHGTRHQMTDSAEGVDLSFAKNHEIIISTCSINQFKTEFCLKSVLYSTVFNVIKIQCEIYFISLNSLSYQMKKIRFSCLCVLWGNVGGCSMFIMKTGLC